MADDDLDLSIPLKSLVQEFDCPICFNPLTDATITPCGHNFCEQCILECINRNHHCPSCRHDCVRDQLVRNHHLDNLLQIITTEKDTASRKYFESLITPHGGGKSPLFGDEQPTAVAAERRLSPIETVFQKHLRRSLGAYDDYYKELRKKYEESCVHTRQEAAHEMAKASAVLKTRIRQLEMAGKDANAAKAELDTLVSEKRRECEERLDAMQVSFDRSVDLLVNSYDAWLTSNLTAPALLPVAVSIRIVARDIMINDVSIRPLDCLPVVQDAVRRRLEELGNGVVSLPREVTFVLRRPFVGGEAAREDEGVTPLVDENVPLFQCGLVPGSVIEMRGDLKLKSDVCFSALPFDKAAGVAVDYMTCKDCKEKWICPSCASICHRGHTVTMYIKGHVPQYAACYCFKTKRCCLENAKTLKTAGPPPPAAAV